MYIYPKCPRCSTAIKTHSDDAIKMYHQRHLVAIECPNCDLEIQMRHPDKEDFISSLKPERPEQEAQDLEDYREAADKQQTGETDDGDED
jgi:hypothetical protein